MAPGQGYKTYHVLVVFDFIGVVAQQTTASDRSLPLRSSSKSRFEQLRLQEPRWRRVGNDIAGNRFFQAATPSGELPSLFGRERRDLIYVKAGDGGDR